MFTPDSRDLSSTKERYSYGTSSNLFEKLPRYQSRRFVAIRDIPILELRFVIDYRKLSLPTGRQLQSIPKGFKGVLVTQSRPRDTGTLLADKYLACDDAV